MGLSLPGLRLPRLIVRPISSSRSRFFSTERERTAAVMVPSANLVLDDSDLRVFAVGELHGLGPVWNAEPLRDLVALAAIFVGLRLKAHTVG